MWTEQARLRLRGIIEPMARLLATWGVTANQLTVFGCLLHIFVAILLGAGHLVRGGLLLAIAAAVDGLDGALARHTNQTTLRGAFLDSTLDRVSEILVFGGILALAYRLGDPLLGFFAYAALTGSLMVSYTRAKSESLGVGTSVGWLGRMERMVILVIGLLIGQATLVVVVVGIGSWITAGQRLFDLWSRATEDA